MSSVNVSISTHCLSTSPLPEALETLQRYTSVVELMNDGLHYTQKASILNEFPYEYTIHAPARSVNIASVLSPIRRASVDLIGESLNLAASCNAKRVVFHPGYYTFQEEFEKSVTALRTSLAEIQQISEDTGISCCIENMGRWQYFYLQKDEELTLVSGTEFCLDIGHANECGRLSAFLTHPFTHIHVHDNDGTADTHLALGKGNIDVSSVIAAIQKNHITSPVSECGTLEDAVRTKAILETML